VDRQAPYVHRVMTYRGVVISQDADSFGLQLVCLLLARRGDPAAGDGDGRTRRKAADEGEESEKALRLYGG
jgi:hypothetical protein